ncbi:hypothetical protein PIB30_032796 [Stylosanthes scabra]|uniref:Uncharacterized protein n=1 Tax=Stylosanthes scabra TaxID=79078 RepID=A0ABU6WF94_9FABA|nr:hypothetical protein [Stylosanthes scabra]
MGKLLAGFVLPLLKFSSPFVASSRVRSAALINWSLISLVDLIAFLVTMYNIDRLEQRRSERMIRCIRDKEEVRGLELQILAWKAMSGSVVKPKSSNGWFLNAIWQKRKHLGTKNTSPSLICASIALVPFGRNCRRGKKGKMQNGVVGALKELPHLAGHRYGQPGLVFSHINNFCHDLDSLEVGMLQFGYLSSENVTHEGGVMEYELQAMTPDILNSINCSGLPSQDYITNKIIENYA